MSWRKDATATRNLFIDALIRDVEGPGPECVRCPSWRENFEAIKEREREAQRVEGLPLNKKPEMVGLGTYQAVHAAMEGSREDLQTVMRFAELLETSLTETLSGLGHHQRNIQVFIEYQWQLAKTEAARE